MYRLILTKKVCSLLWVLIVGSFVGFCVENIWISFRHGYMDNRGGYFPFLLGYGMACLLIYVLFGLPESPRIMSQTYDNSSPLTYFVSIFIAILCGESLFGIIIEKVTTFKWWDYSSIPLHIGKYTSIPTSLGFTLCVYAFMEYAFPVLSDMGGFLFDLEFGKVILFVAGLLLADTLHMLVYMYKYHELFPVWRYQYHKLSFVKE